MRAASVEGVSTTDVNSMDLNLKSERYYPIHLDKSKQYREMLTFNLTLDTNLTYAISGVHEKN